MDKADYYMTDDKLANRRNGEISRRLRRREERREGEGKGGKGGGEAVRREDVHNTSQQREVRIGKSRWWWWWDDLTKHS